MQKEFGHTRRRRPSLTKLRALVRAFLDALPLCAKERESCESGLRKLSVPELIEVSSAYGNIQDILPKITGPLPQRRRTKHTRKSRL